MNADLVLWLRAAADAAAHDPPPWKMLAAAADTIETLTAERDEARRMYCGRVSRDVQPDAFDIAKNHGWDCFPQEDDK